MNRYNLQNIEGGGFDYKVGINTKRRLGSMKRILTAPLSMAKDAKDRISRYIGNTVRNHNDRIIDNNVRRYSDDIAQRQMAFRVGNNPDIRGGKRNSTKLYTKKDKKKIDGVVKVIYSKKNSQKLYVKSNGKMMNLVKYKKMNKKTKKQKNKK
tara:strand:- start:1058 stop:1516 length:459 start_codon:yes stop_codon:yes gene_type:complete